MVGSPALIARPALISSRGLLCRGIGRSWRSDARHVRGLASSAWRGRISKIPWEQPYDAATKTAQTRDTDGRGGNKESMPWGPGQGRYFCRDFAQPSQVVRGGVATSDAPGGLPQPGTVGSILVYYYSRNTLRLVSSPCLRSQSFVNSGGSGGADHRPGRPTGRPGRNHSH